MGAGTKTVRVTLGTINWLRKARCYSELLKATSPCFFCFSRRVIEGMALRYGKPFTVATSAADSVSRGIEGNRFGADLRAEPPALILIEPVRRENITPRGSVGREASRIRMRGRAVGGAWRWGCGCLVHGPFEARRR